MRRIIMLCSAIMLLFSACSSRSYEDGYAAGYADGYQAALTTTIEAVIEEPFSESTAPEDTPEPEPINGYIFEDFEFYDCVAPLTIEATAGGGYYFVIDPVSFLVTENTEFYNTRAELHAKYFYKRIYVKGGSTVSVKVPLGSYEIYYAHGDSWYGEDELFGSDTQYYKCDATFLFEETQNDYNGWTISLDPVANGNLDTESISAENFPK